MILTAKRTKVVEENFTVQDYYLDDSTARGRIVDALIEPFKHHERTARNRLLDDDAGVVSSALSDLDQAYKTADRIIQTLVAHGYVITEQKK